MKQEAIAATEAPEEFDGWVQALPGIVQAYDEGPGAGMPNVETVGSTAALLLQVKMGLTCIETWRKEQGLPYHAAKKITDAHYKPAIAVLERLEVLLKDQICTLAGSREAERQAAIQAGTTPPAPLEVEGVTLTQAVDFKLLNIELVPDEYKKLDEKKVAAKAKEHDKAGTDCYLPGIKFFRKFRAIASTKGK